MVARFFPAFDNEALIIDVSSPSGTAGDPVINNSDTPNGTIFVFQGGFPPVEIELDDTGGDPDVFADGDPGGHEIIDGGGIVANGTGVESESILTFQQIDADDNPIGDPIEITVYSQNGNFNNIWGFGTDTALIPGARYEKVAGQNAGASAYADFVTCFVTGTLIATVDGEVPVETIKPGDMVLTQDLLARPVRWVGRREVVPTGALAPVRIEAGVLGNRRDLVVSQQHRIHMSDFRAGLMFDSCDVLVPAKALVGEVPGIIFDTSFWRTTYCHLLFDRHELVWSEGILTESFHPGETALDALTEPVRHELQTIFPDLAERTDAWPLACRSLRPFETRALVRKIPYNSSRTDHFSGEWH